MEEKEFSIQFDKLDHTTWQGVLRMEGRELPFCSELELLLTIDRSLRGALAQDPQQAPDGAPEQTGRG